MLAIQQIMIRYSMESKLVSQSVFGFVYYMILLQYDISSPPTSCREQVRNLVDFLIMWEPTTMSMRSDLMLMLDRMLKH